MILASYGQTHLGTKIAQEDFQWWFWPERGQNASYCTPALMATRCGTEGAPTSHEGKSDLHRHEHSQDRTLRIDSDARAGLGCVGDLIVDLLPWT